MDISIIEEKENPFLNRKELRIELKHIGSATPAKANLLKELATKYNVPEDQVIVDYILTKKGISESFVKVKILKEKPKVKTRVKENKVKGEKVEAQASPAA
jgi:ribosomal protein S24E